MAMVHLLNLNGTLVDFLLVGYTTLSSRSSMEANCSFSFTPAFCVQTLLWANSISPDKFEGSRRGSMKIFKPHRNEVLRHDFSVRTLAFTIPFAEKHSLAGTVGFFSTSCSLKPLRQAPHPRRRRHHRGPRALLRHLGLPHLAHHRPLVVDCQPVQHRHPSRLRW